MSQDQNLTITLHLALDVVKSFTETLQVDPQVKNKQTLHDAASNGPLEVVWFFTEKMYYNLGLS